VPVDLDVGLIGENSARVVEMQTTNGLLDDLVVGGTVQENSRSLAEDDPFRCFDPDITNRAGDFSLQATIVLEGSGCLFLEHPFPLGPVSASNADEHLEDFVKVRGALVACEAGANSDQIAWARFREDALWWNMIIRCGGLFPAYHTDLGWSRFHLSSLVEHPASGAAR